MIRIGEMIGCKFGGYTCLEILPNRRVRVQCNCGNIRELFVTGVRVNEIGCGDCSYKHKTRKPSEFKITHGMHDTKIYRTWQKMLSRCNNSNNPRYSSYGGRGIEVCAEWHIFENFYHDMGDKPDPSLQIDRIDNNKGYSKDNCRWATRHEQYRNRRSNRFITFNGETLCIVDWATRLGISNGALQKRLRTKSIECALTPSRLPIRNQFSA